MQSSLTPLSAPGIDVLVSSGWPDPVHGAFTRDSVAVALVARRPNASATSACVEPAGLFQPVGDTCGSSRDVVVGNIDVQTRKP